jgi:iron complex transport system substrate-binding protein
MTRTRRAAVACLLALAGCRISVAIAAAPPVDAANRPASRMISLAPSLTELAFAAGAGDRLVAVSAYSDYPDDARKLPQVADAGGIAWESLLALQPDLVLAWRSGTRAADIARLGQLGIRVEVIEITKLADVPAAMRLIGKLTANLAAEGAARQFEQRLAGLQAANARKPVVSTFFEISAKPLMTINGGHVISEMISMCGGRNVFAGAPALVPEPAREELAARNPEAILYGFSGNAERVDRAALYAGVANYRPGRAHAITADYAYRPGPRLLLAAAEICTALDAVRATAGASVTH